MRKGSLCFVGLSLHCRKGSVLLDCHVIVEGLSLICWIVASLSVGLLFCCKVFSVWKRSLCFVGLSIHCGRAMFCWIATSLRKYSLCYVGLSGYCGRFHSVLLDCHVIVNGITLCFVGLHVTSLWKE